VLSLVLVLLLALPRGGPNPGPSRFAGGGTLSRRPPALQFDSQTVAGNVLPQSVSPQ
jgi:hypothetical protein